MICFIIENELVELTCPEKYKDIVSVYAQTKAWAETYSYRWKSWEGSFFTIPIDISGDIEDVIFKRVIQEKVYGT